MNISIQKSCNSKSARSLAGAAAVLAATLGVSLLGPHRAYAAPHPSLAAGANDLGVTILSPDPQVPLSGVKPVEISAFYQGSPANQIIAIELFIDGAKAATKTLDAPETRGVVSFLVDAGQISAGSHQIVIRATAADQEVQSAKSRFTFNGMDGIAPELGTNPSSAALTPPASPALSSGLPPTLRLFSPSPDGRVQGTVTLRVEATDPSGKAPYVSLFIDKTFKTLRNYAPYEFEWDTTAYSNGYHTIEAYGYSDSTTNVGHAKTLRLYVNNPGGETGIRRDLLDAAPVVKPVRVPAAPQVRPLRIVLPKKSLSPARIASLTPRPLRSTREIVREMTSGAGSLRFGSLDFASELSTPFAADKPAYAAAPAARVRNFKPLRAADKTIVAHPASDLEALALMAETPARTFGSKVRLPQIASIRLPGNNLTSPFVALPHVSPLTQPAAKMALRPLAHAPMKMHALHVHLPMGIMSDLLRSAGQKTLLFNSKTVTMDRPLTAQNSILFGPLRQIFEQGGGTLTWEASTGTVRAKSATENIVLTVGDTHAQVNAKKVTLDGKPYLMLGRTMVPLSFIAVAMNATVQFDAATGHLLVTSRK
jgi:hypothetical protein